jgi:hypothetical protein
LVLTAEVGAALPMPVSSETAQVNKNKIFFYLGESFYGHRLVVLDFSFE